jgi:hypothetical protein
MKKEMTTECYMEKQFSMCCCQCVFLVKDYSHPCSDGKPASNFKSFACIGLLIEDRFHPESGIHSEWPEHGFGCEMFQDRRKEK